MSKQQTPEEIELQQIAQASGKSMRDIYRLVDKVYRDEESMNKRIITAQQQQVASKQYKLQDSELSVRGIELFLLQRKMNRILRRVQRWEKIKSLFTKTKQTNDRSTN